MSGEFVHPGMQPTDPDGLMVAARAGLGFIPIGLQRELLASTHTPAMALLFHGEGGDGCMDGQLILSLGHLSALAGALAEFRNLLPVHRRDQFDANQAEAARQFRNNLPLPAGEMRGVWL